MSEILKKYYPFWMGLFMVILFFVVCIKYNVASFAVVGGYLIGFFKLGKLHGDESIE